MASKEVQSATAEIGKTLYHTELHARTHALVADEPLDVGGLDEGPRPGDFMRMALASCTAITLRMYADRKQFDVEKIRVKVSNGPFDQKTVYTSEVEIVGKLTDEQRDRMLQIAKLCPVHKTLTNPVEIQTQLKVVG
jgi:putative redox protein